MKISHMLGLVLFWPALAVVLWGELKTQPSALEQAVWDKALHFTAYWGLAGIGTAAVSAGRKTWYVIFGLIALGGLLEIVQGIVGRDMSAADELANSLGAFAGAACAWGLFALIARIPTR